MVVENKYYTFLFFILQTYEYEMTPFMCRVGTGEIFNDILW